MPRSQQAAPGCTLTQHCVAPNSRGKGSVRANLDHFCTAEKVHRFAGDHPETLGLPEQSVRID